MLEENYVYDFWEYQPINQKIIETIEYRKLSKFKFNKILILAGAGMSQESNLPVFNGSVKFQSNVSQKEIIDLFDNQEPHEGYKLLLEICKGKEYYILTSNIDDYFRRAGFDPLKIIEIHGNIHYIQCSNGCSNTIKKYEPDETICKQCGEKMIPNVMTSGLSSFIDKTSEIEKRMMIDIKSGDWTIIEIGAGINLPVIRDYSEILIEDYSKTMNLIRINPEHWQIPSDILSKKTVRIPHGAIKGIKILISYIKS